MDSEARRASALIEAEVLQELFETSALGAVERRIAYSFDRPCVDDVMFFLDVYNYVNGGDVLLPAGDERQRATTVPDLTTSRT